jgi:hypothetical protein
MRVLADTGGAKECLLPHQLISLMSYPGGVESFDAYHGPITSTYSELWWTQSSDALPQAIIERFKGGVIIVDREHRDGSGAEDPPGRRLRSDQRHWRM